MLTGQVCEIECHERKEPSIAFQQDMIVAEARSPEIRASLEIGSARSKTGTRSPAGPEFFDLLA